MNSDIKTPSNYCSVLWFRGICGGVGGIGGSFGRVTSKANFTYDKQGILKLHYKLLCQLVQKLKTKINQKVVGQDGGLQQFMPP